MRQPCKLLKGYMYSKIKLFKTNDIICKLQSLLFVDLIIHIVNKIRSYILACWLSLHVISMWFQIILFIMCSANELFFCMLYLTYFTPGPTCEYLLPPAPTHTHMKYYRHNPKTSEYVNGVKLVDEIWNWFNHTLICGN